MRSMSPVTMIQRLSVRSAGIVCLIALMTLPTSAQHLINLNFTGAAYTGTTETSPATPSGPAGTWNNLTNGVANGADSYETDSVAVLLSNGSTGPTLTFDTTSGGNGDWAGTSLGFLATDYTTPAGVYDVGNLYESGLRNNGNATTGFRIKGLTSGNYEVFLVPMFRNPQAAGEKADAAVTFSIGLGNDTDARNVGNFTLSSTTASPTQNIATNLTSWTAATDGSTAYNYIGATVSIDSPNRWLTFLLPDSATSGPDRPGPSVIQLRSTSAPVDVLGDFNQNGKVDGADYVVWRENEGLSITLPNSGSLTSPVGQDHYNLWRSKFGNVSGSASTANLSNNAVPEPNTLFVAIVVSVAMWGRSRFTRQ
jgi:hypothetical protein